MIDFIRATKRVLCSSCNGGGQSFSPSGSVHVDSKGNIDQDGTWTDCPDCGGTGGKDVDFTLKERSDRLEYFLAAKIKQRKPVDI